MSIKKRIIIIGSGSAGSTVAALVASKMASFKTIVINATASIEATARPLEVTAESKDGKAQIRIIGRIANWNGNNSSDFQRKVDALIKVHTEAELYINSAGGDVFTATEINNQLKRFKTVKIVVGAMAASAATYFTASHYTSAYANSQIMIHKPMLGTHGNEDEIKKALKLLSNITKDYLKKYADKSGKTVAEIEALWVGGDHWMSAEEALEDGFIDAIIEEEGKLSAEDVTILEACGAPIVPKATTNKQKPKQKQIMDRVQLIAFLGLEADATDKQITAAQNKMKLSAEKHTQAEAAKKTAEVSASGKKAETLVDAAITAKKISADQKATYLELATANYDAAKLALDAMTGKPKLSDNLKETPVGDDAIEASRKAWTLEDYIEKDEPAYLKMKAENPKQAEALEAAYFETK